MINKFNNLLQHQMKIKFVKKIFYMIKKNILQQKSIKSQT